MLRIIAKHVNVKLFAQNKYFIKNWKLPSSEIDSAGLTGFFQCRNQTYLTFSQKMSQFSAGNMYSGLDQWSRELLISLSTNFDCGLATSIILVTFAIKTLFLYPTLRAQMQGLKQTQLTQLVDTYKDRMKTAQMTKNKMLMSQAQYDYKLGMKKKGINTMVPLVNLLQIPFLLTWFFSLRYLSNLPQIYPQILTEGYLWFTDLSTYDPYFILPVSAAICTSISIARSPNLARNKVSLPMMAPFVKYLKFMPFFSLAFTGFFPASINLYWLCLGAYQLMITELMHTNMIKRHFDDVSNDDAKRKILRFQNAVFIEDKQTSADVMNKSNSTLSNIKNDLSDSGELQLRQIKVSSKRIKKLKGNA